MAKLRITWKRSSIGRPEVQNGPSVPLVSPNSTRQ